MHPVVNMNKEKWIMLLVVGTIVAAIALRASSTRWKLDDREWATVEVKPGDTLWDVAERCAPPGTDPRLTLHVIEQANHKRSNIIEPGDVLAVPTPGGVDRLAEGHASRSG